MKVLLELARAMFVLLIVSAGPALVRAESAFADTPSGSWTPHTSLAAAHSVAESLVDRQARIDDRCASTGCAADCGTFCQMPGPGCCLPAADIGCVDGTMGLRWKTAAAPKWCAPEMGGLVPQVGKRPPRNAA